MELPVIFNRTLNEGTRLFVFLYGDFTEEELTEHTKLSDAEKAYLASVSHPNRRKEWVAIRTFLQNNMGFTDCQIVYNEKGAPVLKNPDLNLSISHSSGKAAIILSETQKVGVDIEVRANKVLRTVAKYLSEAEQNFLDRKFRDAHALVCWSAKECAYKIFDRPGTSFKENMRVKPFKLDSFGNIIVKLFTDDGLRDYELKYEQHKDFVVAYGTN